MAAFLVGHIDFSWTGDARAPGEPALSPKPRVLHAALVEAPGPSAALFQDYLRSGQRWRALCGTEVLAITTQFFDDAALWSCRRCAHVMNRWLDGDPVQWENAVRRPR